MGKRCAVLSCLIILCSLARGEQHVKKQQEEYNKDNKRAAERFEQDQGPKNYSKIALPSLEKLKEMIDKDIETKKTGSDELKGLSNKLESDITKLRKQEGGDYKLDPATRLALKDWLENRPPDEKQKDSEIQEALSKLNKWTQP